MANIIQLKRSTTGGNTPTLNPGELAVNLVDKRLFTANNTTVFDAVQNVASDFTISGTTQALRVGNSTVNSVVNSTSITTHTGTYTGNVDIADTLTAVTKSFLINHPTQEGMLLRYGSLEGPENGVYVRGRSNTDVIELPEHWLGLVNAETITVNLTPIGQTELLSVIEITDNKIYISLKENMEYFYMILGERKDVPKLVVEF